MAKPVLGFFPITSIADNPAKWIRQGWLCKAKERVVEIDSLPFSGENVAHIPEGCCRTNPRCVRVMHAQNVGVQLMPVVPEFLETV